MKTLAKTTIRNATKQKLADFVADMTQDIPDYTAAFPALQKKARDCERKSRRWFGETITFEEWANN